MKDQIWLVDEYQRGFSTWAAAVYLFFIIIFFISFVRLIYCCTATWLQRAENYGASQAIIVYMEWKLAGANSYKRFQCVWPQHAREITRLPTTRTLYPQGTILISLLPLSSTVFTHYLVSRREGRQNQLACSQNRTRILSHDRWWPLWQMRGITVSVAACLLAPVSLNLNLIRLFSSRFPTVLFNM